MYRPLVAVGRQEIGYLPGDLDEKLAPWMAAIHDNLFALFADGGASAARDAVEELTERDELEMAAITYLRGRSITAIRRHSRPHREDEGQRPLRSRHPRPHGPQPARRARLQPAVTVLPADTETLSDGLLDPATIDGDHPDPVTLTEPEHDDQGLLRWASLPAPRGS